MIQIKNGKKCRKNGTKNVNFSETLQNAEYLKILEWYEMSQTIKKTKILPEYPKT